MYRKFLWMPLAMLLSLAISSCDTPNESSPAQTHKLTTTQASRLGSKEAPAKDQLASPEDTVSTIALPTATPFLEPLQPVLYELPSGALATWQKFAAAKPVLVLFSTNPLLNPLSERGKSELHRLIASGNEQEIVRRDRALAEDPVILPPQTVSAAIEAHLFSEIVFVLPTSKKTGELTLHDYQSKGFAADFLTEDEARGLSMENGIISGKVRGTPFRCLPPEALPKFHTPVILHIDLGYFKDLFVNDVKTPLYDLMHQAAVSVQKAQLPAAAVTLSYSNQEVGFSLNTRFMISNLADMLRKPELLNGGTPASWALRASAMYASAMFAESTAKELTEKAVEMTPDDPAALYALAIQKFQQKEQASAFDLLDRAVALDRGYALAYLELADRGEELGQWTKAEELLKKASSIMPDDPFIRIQLAKLLITNGQGKEALPLIASLRQLAWSPEYHPQMQESLEDMEIAAKTWTPPKPDEQRSSSETKPKSPAMPRFHTK